MTGSLEIVETSHIRQRYFISIIYNTWITIINTELIIIIVALWMKTTDPTPCPSPQSSTVPPYPLKAWNQNNVNQIFQFEIYTFQFWSFNVLFLLFQFTFYSEFSIHFYFELISCQLNFIRVMKEIMSNFSLPCFKEENS